MSYVSNEERLIFEKELTTVILYECFSKRKYDALKEYYIDDTINIKDNHKLKYYIEVLVKLY